MLAVAHEAGLCALEFDDGRRLGRLEARLGRYYPGCTIEATVGDDDGIIRQVETWLEAYFEGRESDLSGIPDIPGIPGIPNVPNIPNVPLDARGQRFEMLVWSALRQIPPGTTTTYGAIASQIGSPGAARAVGLANGANPIAIIVPCHRVIGANGTLTGYGGGLDRKAWLLNHERAHFFALQGSPAAS